MVMSKAGSEVILKCLLGKAREIDVDSLPWGSDESTPAGVETVVAAETIRPARGKFVEEILIKREIGGLQRVGLEHPGDRTEDGGQEVFEIKEEPIE